MKTASVGPIPAPRTNCQKRITHGSDVAARFVNRSDPIPTSTTDASSSALYRPVRATIWPLTMLETMTPTSSGNSS